ncbi:MAG TPA: PIN domain-containing protein [Dehalococcoidia bacterium]|jgi:predicted nucleic acid-binding protein|nr:PIN domain-containing protein [Dehalococcoidia bacterium]
MKFLDTNVFLRFLVEPATDDDRRKQAACLALFNDVAAGATQITTSEAILHELLYVLCSSRQYRLSHEDAVARLRPILALRGFHLSQKRTLLHAVELFEAYAYLDFADAVAITRSQEGGDELLSYDRDFDKVPGAERHEP